MYFDFEDKPDIERIGHTFSWGEEVALTGILHALLVLAILLAPPMNSSALNAEQQMALERQRERDDATRFVFVQPHLDMPATRPVSPRADASDKDRNAQAPERSKMATNAMPFSRGNTFERTEATPPPTPAQPAPPSPQPDVPGQNGGASTPSQAPAPGASTSPLFAMSPRGPNAAAASGLGAGLMGGAERQAQQLARQDNFENPGGGGGQYGQSIQFDSKGVEFGPWIRRFIAQIKRNWVVPLAAMAMKGHVLVEFYVAKDGTISALAVSEPCNVSAFNNAAFNALAASSPTYPLPKEYPSDKAFFRVMFYYNEAPPGGAYDR